MMQIPAAEREKMLAVRPCGPRVIARLEAIGVTQLRDLAERDSYQLVHEINIAAGRPIWHPPIATQPMANLIAAARQEPNADTACVRPAVTGPSAQGTKRHEHRKRTQPAPCSHLSASINMPATWALQCAVTRGAGASSRTWFGVKAQRRGAATVMPSTSLISTRSQAAGSKFSALSRPSQSSMSAWSV